MKLDRAEIKASHDFHVQHFLNIAEAAIRNHHREMYYGALTTNVEDVVGHYPAEQLPAELQEAVLKDMAFMEGHLEAFGEVLRAIEELKKK